MQDKNNEKTAYRQMQPCNCVPQDKVIYEREKCRDGLYTTLENYFSDQSRFLILQSDMESIISYADSQEAKTEEIVTKLELFQSNLKLLVGLETFARPLFDKSHKNFLPNGRF